MDLVQNFLIEWVFRGQDGAMSQISIIFMASLIAVFFFFSIWYFVPVTIRWIQLRINVLFTLWHIRKIANLKETRKQIGLRLFKNSSWARKSYNHFRITWEDARLPNEDKAVYPINLREFLTPEIVIDTAVNRRIVEALPGIFVALGIFGTFLGLVLGLRGMNIHELANLKQGVGQLLSGLSLAFYTSLIGIAISVIFSFFYRFIIRRLEKALFKLDELFVTLFPYHPYEHYVRKHLELQGDVKQGLQTLATDVATKIKDTIAPAMDEALLKHLVPIMQDLQIKFKEIIEDSKQQQLKIMENFGEHIENMSGVITEHFENSQKKQSEAMEGVLGQYVEEMNKAFMVQFQDMGRIIEDTTRVQSEIKAQMVQFTEQLQKQFESQTSLIEKTSRAAQILNESLESLEGISRELKSSAADISSAAMLLKESAAKAMEGQENIRESMDIQIHAMTNTREELEKSWDTITTNTDSTIQLVREVIKELSEGVGEQLNKALVTFDSAVAEVLERFSGTLFETNQTIEELPGILIKMGENFEAIRTDISTQKDILDELRNTTKEIVAPNIERAAHASKELSNTAENITRSTAELREWFEEVIERIKSSSGALEDKTTETFHELKRLSGKILKGLDRNVEVFDEGGFIYSTLVQLNNAMTAMSQQAHGDDGGTAEAIQTLNNNLVNLIKHIEKTTEGNGQVNEKLLETVKATVTHVTNVTRDIRKEFVQELRSIKESTGKMVLASDELKSALTHPESKRGLFGIIRKK